MLGTPLGMMYCVITFLDNKSKTLNTQPRSTLKSIKVCRL